MKKNWSNPRVKELNLKSTNEVGMKCPDEPVHAIEGEERFPVNIICSYPGCTHFKMIDHPNCYCHRNSSLPGGGPELSKS